MKKTLIMGLCFLLMNLMVASVNHAQNTTNPIHSLTKEQIIERVGQIDKQLLLLEKQELIKKFQELDAKEKASKPLPKKEDKK